MFIQDRDRQIVLSIGRFSQLSAGQLRSLHFHELASNTPLKRTLKRLVEQGYLARIERRMVGGTGAGSGQYVYQLGSRGWRALERGKQYRPMRSVQYHTLAIADAYIELLEREREGYIVLNAFTTEPDTWRVIAGVDLRPDLFIEVYDPHKGETLSLWVEVDMGTERPSVIRQKLAMYYHAYQHATKSELEVFPKVLFLAPDSARARDLMWTVAQGREEAQELFMVATMAAFTGVLFT